jgi:hypothetical protein
MYVLAIIVGVCALGAALVAFSRKPQRDDVERFHRARAMTTEWSRHYAATGHLELPTERDGNHHSDHQGHNGHNGDAAHDLEREPAQQRR